MQNREKREARILRLQTAWVLRWGGASIALSLQACACVSVVTCFWGTRDQELARKGTEHMLLATRDTLGGHKMSQNVEKVSNPEVLFPFQPVEEDLVSSGTCLLW